MPAAFTPLLWQKSGLKEIVKPACFWKYFVKMIFDSRGWWSWLCITCVMKTKNRNNIYYLLFTLEVTCYCNNVHVWAMWSEPLSLVMLADLSEFIPATGNADVTSWLSAVNVLKCQSWQLHQQVVFTVVAFFFVKISTQFFNCNWIECDK